MSRRDYYKHGEGIHFHCECGAKFDSADELDEHIAAEKEASKPNSLSYLDYHRWNGCDYQVAPGLPYYAAYSTAAKTRGRLTVLMEPYGWELGSYVVLPLNYEWWDKMRKARDEGSNAMAKRLMIVRMCAR